MVFGSAVGVGKGLLRDAFKLKIIFGGLGTVSFS